MLGQILAALIAVTVFPPDKGKPPPDSFANFREPVLAPLFAGPWKSGRDALDREVGRTHGRRRIPVSELCTAAQDAQFRRQCQLAETSPVDSAVYDSGGFHLTVQPVLLKDAGARALDQAMPLVNDRQRLAKAAIVMFLTVSDDSGNAHIDMSKLSLLQRSGAAASYRAEIVRYSGPPACPRNGVFSCPPPPIAGAAPRDTLIRFAVVIDGDPKTIAGLVLRLSDAIRPESGRTIPDLRFKRAMQYYSPLIP